MNIEQNDTGGFFTKITKKSTPTKITLISTSNDKTEGQIDISNSKKDESNNVGNNNSISGGNITGSKNSSSVRTTSAVTESSNTGLIVGLSIGGLVILIIAFFVNKKYKLIKFGANLNIQQIDQ